ncbi:MAG: hypothetical protein H6500_00780 [Candidatus Woesearchaeota archaeon]|nr:hypothetical protein [Nanoarchaeota archaeon]USN44367.1 MAG: hypothetical protein H6500_00780 [Candidatus Woesearchaeota archaeon]
MEEITLTQALAKLKTLDKRIEKSIEEAYFVELTHGKKAVVGFASNKEFEQEAKSAYQKVNDLIDLRNKLKTAIVDANAKSTLTVAGENMTLAQAIERKNSIKYEKLLLGKLKYQFNRVKENLETNNEKVKEKLDKLLEANFGKESKSSDKDVEAISKPYLEQNEYKIVDPIKVAKAIEKLEEKITKFEEEVDFKLSEANTITKINV